jgi:hypothetical protein
METFALKYRQPIRGFKTSPKDLFLPDHKLKLYMKLFKINIFPQTYFFSNEYY